MEKKDRTNFNPKKEVSVMAWIENDQGAVLFVRHASRETDTIELGFKDQRP
jgi:hypothetical protein